METTALQEFFRSKDSTWEMESLELLMLRKMVLLSRRSLLETMRELVGLKITHLTFIFIKTMFAGQYSYIDENGNTIVVKYSAGVNGFR